MCGFLNPPEEASDWRMPDGLARFLAASGGAPVVLNGDKRVVSLDTCSRY